MTKGNIPRHVGFIMDGNGRWAKEHGKPRTFGHKKGADVIHEIVSASFNGGIEVVSLYAFSTENWARPKDEVDSIFDLLRKFLKKYAKELIDEEIKLIISGDLSALPENLRSECLERIADTCRFSEHVLNIAINYGSKAEIVRAVNQALKNGKTQISEEDIAENSYTKGLPDIDLIVRTGGEQRLSNFFLWQAAYAELYFTDVYWPDFHKKQLGEAIGWFSNRQRRFGDVSPK
ncbi:MAG: di-trans,poly-cis-decaprenylcistransferase [Clostridia bacterium]|nr:di-trans,poly-cis-decaprenylcistransferase [Clostridia bacterium]